MRKIPLFFVLLFISAIACAETISSRELIETAELHDGGRVTYSGEAVTQVMDRGEHSWVNLGDGANAIGVWCMKASLGKVSFLGGYKTKGDVLEVEGVFHRACPEHGGELDIHAESVRLIERGYILKEAINRGRLRLSAGLFLLVVLLAVIFRRRL